MLSPTFRHKVAMVKQHVEQAEDDAQALKWQISSEEQKVKGERAELQTTRKSIDRIAGEIEALHHRSSFSPMGSRVTSRRCQDQMVRRGSATVENPLLPNQVKMGSIAMDADLVSISQLSAQQRQRPDPGESLLCVRIRFIPGEGSG